MNKSEHNRKAYNNYKPYPFRLGELKTKLQELAFEKESSIHAEGIAIMEGYFKKREFIDSYIQKLTENVRILEELSKQLK